MGALGELALIRALGMSDAGFRDTRVRSSTNDTFDLRMDDGTTVDLKSVTLVNRPLYVHPHKRWRRPTYYALMRIVETTDRRIPDAQDERGAGLVFEGAVPAGVVFLPEHIKVLRTGQRMYVAPRDAFIDLPYAEAGVETGIAVGVGAKVPAVGA